MRFSLSPSSPCWLLWPSWLSLISLRRWPETATAMTVANTNTVTALTRCPGFMSAPPSSTVWAGIVTESCRVPICLTGGKRSPAVFPTGLEGKVTRSAGRSRGLFRPDHQVSQADTAHYLHLERQALRLLLGLQHELGLHMSRRPNLLARAGRRSLRLEQLRREHRQIVAPIEPGVRPLTLDEHRFEAVFLQELHRASRGVDQEVLFSRAEPQEVEAAFGGGIVQRGE